MTVDAALAAEEIGAGAPDPVLQVVIDAVVRVLRRDRRDAEGTAA